MRLDLHRGWLACLAVLGLVASASAASKQLHLFIWSEYIAPGVVQDFERAFDCKVVIDLYEDNATMMAKLQSGGASIYDVAVPTDHQLPALIKSKLIAPLRLERLSNLTNIEQRFLNPPYDPGNRYSVPYQWGTLGLYVRRDGRKPIEPTWGLVFDPAQQAGSFVLLDSGRDLIGAALKYRGHSLNSTESAPLREARDLLLAAKRRCLAFDGSVGAKNKVLSKNARVAVVYSGEAARGMAEDPETSYLIPKEGTQLWVDTLVVLSGAPHPELAEQFINFVLEAKNGARISNYTQFATPNQAAHAFIKAEDFKNPAIYPPPEVAARLEFNRDLGRHNRLWDEVWTQVKAR